MRKLLTLYFLVRLMTSCNRNVEPDAATMIAGKYEVVKVKYMGFDITGNYKSTITVTRLTASTVHAETTFPYGTSPVSDTWTVTKVANDSIAIKTSGQYVIRNQNNEIYTPLADGSLELLYRKSK
ncbi:hypothetical protein [Larkinella rosea]|uniref:Lipocalin-like domain-containing protein n=1 Tax=Larkinella rosea TaxID=2025312 RepID=A0A3P1BF83_9BACT|nr:hypothetical protein [Larkinella rosea]RRA99727.1 hypothetical protein EHT25_24125 [Larkinella rosea]